MATPEVLLLRTPGTNCDGELAYAFETAGAKVSRVHLNRLRETPGLLGGYQILALPGGFSYGDDIAAGKILATALEHQFADPLREFRDAGNLILGVCNGFQTLLKAGLLLPPDEDGPLATLTGNTSGRFGDRWVHLTAQPSGCPFLKGIERMEVPVAHGEGRFVSRAGWILDGLGQVGRVVLRYAPPPGGAGGGDYNPNGSQGDVAGLCDASGQVLGLMPHPERAVLATQGPHWTRDGRGPHGDGRQLFRNAVDYFR